MAGADTEYGMPLVDLLRGLILFIYYWLEGIALAIIPSSFQRKTVSGEKVLITGAGRHACTVDGDVVTEPENERVCFANLPPHSCQVPFVSC